MEGEPAVLRGAYQVRVGEYLGVSAWLGRRSRGMRLSGIAFVAMTALSLVAAPPGSPAGLSPGDFVFLAAMLVFGVSLVTGWYCVPFVLWQTRKRPDLFTSPTDVFADAAGITIRNATFSSAARWGTFDRWHDERDWLVLVRRGGGAYILPKRAFEPDGLARIRGYLAAVGSTIEATEHADATATGAAAADVLPDGEEAAAVVTGTYSQTPREIGAAMAWFVRRSRTRRVVAAGFAAIGLYFGWQALPTGNILAVVLSGNPVIFAALIVSGWLDALSIWMATRRRRDVWEQKASIRVDAEGIHLRSAVQASDLSWTTFRRVLDNPSHLFLDFGSGQVIIVPKRAFDAAGLVEVRRLADVALGGPGTG